MYQRVVEYCVCTSIQYYYGKNHMRIAMKFALVESIVECQRVRSKQIFRLVFFLCYNSIEKRTIKKDYITDRTYNCIWIYFEMYSFIHSMFRRFFFIRISFKLKNKMDLAFTSAFAWYRFSLYFILFFFRVLLLSFSAFCIDRTDTA